MPSSARRALESALLRTTFTYRLALVTLHNCTFWRDLRMHSESRHFHRRRLMPRKNVTVN